MQPPMHQNSGNGNIDGLINDGDLDYQEYKPREPSIQGRIIEPAKDENEKSVLVAREVRRKTTIKKDLSPRKEDRRQSRGKSLIQAQRIEKNTNSLDVFKKNVQHFIEGKAYTITMMIVTVYALFGDDIRQFSSTKSTDAVFYVLTIICMSLFTIEIILNCICKPDYILGFYFWLDLIATVSMFLDIGWITDSIFGGSVINGNAKQMKKIGTASKAGRRAGQVIRVIRLVRLVKLYKHANLQLEKENQRREILKLIEAAQQAEANNKDIQTNHPQANSGPLIKYQEDERQEEQSKFIDFVKMEEGQGRQSSARGKLPPISKSHTLQIQNQILSDPPSSKSREEQQFIPPPPVPRKSKILEQAEMMNIQPESKVGQTLSDKTMRSVITIILSIVISVPLFNLNTYQDPISSYATGLDRIFELQSQNATFDFSFRDYVNFHKGQNEPVIFVFVNLSDTVASCCSFDSQNNYSLFDGNYAMPNDLRLDDTNLYLSFDADDNLKAYSVTDNRYTTSVNAGLSIIRTIFVSCVLAISAVVFTKDVQTLVLDPIDRMLKKVDRIAKNPLEAAQIEEQEELFMEQLEQQQDKYKLETQKELQKMETAILEKLIMKIGALLAVGFGEAGSEIIAANMQGGEVDPMLPGKKMMAIFGFCDIRNFTDATEVLQQGVMVFVNEIAEIVHGTVDHYSGAANKNIGDAFLLVWKFRPEDYYLDQQDGKMKLAPSKYVQQLCDFAVISFLKIITGITISKKLVKYKVHPGLNERLPNYSVKMGFGLHLGWAIEGAIGSTYKIDASYLSPNVNMASRLEAATKQFGSSILISGILKKQLSTKCQDHLRHIDTVTVKGSLEPVEEIHTVDVSFKNLNEKITSSYDTYDSASLTRAQRKRFRVMNRFKRDKLKEEVTQGDKEVSEEFSTDPELIAIREVYTKTFYALWEQGFIRYIDGNWAEAAKIFEQTLDYIQDHKDGPSNTLLQVIKEEGGKAPSSWAGYRELTEK